MAESNNWATIQRIERNDPLLTDLWVGDRSHPDHQSTEEEGVFSLSSMQGGKDDDVLALLARLGESIGRNTHLKGFYYDGGGNNNNNSNGNELPSNTNTSRIMPPAEFFDGLKRNAGFSSLTLKSCDTSCGTGRLIVDAFSDNENITCLTISDCESLLRNDVLASTLSRLKGLHFISFSGSYIGDEKIEGIVSAIMEVRFRLRELHLSVAGIGNIGCRALAPLLRDPDCKLEELMLGGNDINDAGAIILADALADNSTVEELNLEFSQGITDSGWGAFSRVLCDTSSIDDTYYSNHTLEIIDGGVDTPDDISSLCDLNGSSLDKGQVAIKKILRNHAHFDMEPFLESDLKMLPLVIDWFDRASSVAEDIEVNVDARKLSSMFQFVRMLPMMCVPSVVGSGSKRKQGE